jgi:S1-C subfamily serine protease
MFPYQFDPPAPSAPPSPPMRPRRLAATALLMLALIGGALGGSTLGVIAGARWLAPLAVPAVTPLPAALPAASAATSVGDVYRRVGPAVVELGVSGQGGRGAGSGVVVDASGLIITNNHVVAQASRIAVRFRDGTTRTAAVLRTDPTNDLALLRVDLPPGSAVAPLGDSDQVQVGDDVIAIGNPFGLEQTVTQGIVSAVQRDWRPGTPQGLIQTDAAINPGNSGGPLFNANGEVIGITSMIASPVPGSVGIGFAVPSNTAKQLLP